MELKLDRLVKKGINEPVKYGDGATPIVAVLKEDGTVRICGDSKVTTREVSKIDTYSIPKIIGRTFTKKCISKVHIVNFFLMKSQGTSQSSIFNVVYFATINFHFIIFSNLVYG